MEYRILGPVEVRVGGAPLYIGGPREGRCLVALLLHANHGLSTERLVHILWGDEPPPTAATQIRNTIATLRRHLAQANGGQAPITRAGAGFTLAVADGELDAAVFDNLVNQGRTLAEQGHLEAAATALRRALALWRGRALGGLDGPVLDAAAYGLEEQRLSCLERRLELDLALGRHQDLVGELATLVDEYPLRERLVELRLLCLYRAGRRQDALTAFTAMRTRLAEQLGLDPRPDLVRLHQAILRGDASLDLPPSGAQNVGTPSRPTPAQLPADVPTFVGRTPHLQQLDALRPADNRDQTVAVSMIVGTAGVGKTALAVHWAHQAADCFPDGQLFANLRGFDPAGTALRSQQVLQGFLDALDVPSHRVPTGVEAQIGLYRSLLAGRRMLVVLDNARDAEQVRPLLPGSPGCRVVVTSRNQLAGLVAAEGAHVVALDLFTEDEAREMFIRRIGPARVGAEPAAVDELVESSARLPLALAIVAARAATHPGLTLTAVVDQLRDTGDSLGFLDNGDPVTNVRAALSWSYRTLSGPAARLFRLLSVHPGPDIAAPAAASLAETSSVEVAGLLNELASANLLTERSPGRYAFHDLLRAYSAELARTEHPDAAAELRTIDHYLHTGHSGAMLLYPQRAPIELRPAQAGVTPEVLTDRAGARAWFSAEQPTMLALTQQAATRGEFLRSWQLAWSLADFLEWRGHWHDLVATQHVALAAADQLGDIASRARTHRAIANAYTKMGHDDAYVHLRLALQDFADLGDVEGQAHTYLNLSILYERRGDHAEAFRQAERSLRLYRTGNDRRGLAIALNMVGWDHAQLDRHKEALDCCEEALVILRQIGDRHGEAGTWDSLGYAHHHLGSHAKAIECYDEALALFRDLGNRYNEADTLLHRGDAQQAVGEIPAARDSWQRALVIFRDLGHADAETVQSRLH